MSEIPRSTGSFGMDRQLQIYLAGLHGITPDLPIAPDALEARAREVLSPEAYDYVAGSAATEETAAANRTAFRRWRIVPRMLRDVARRDLTVELFGRTLPAPVLLAPIGVQGIIRPEAEREVARAAASVGLPFVLSTVSSHPIESVAEVSGPRWFQLYWPRDQELAASLVHRAERAGYEALVVTLDTHILGWRPRDLQRAFLPFLQGQGLANYFSDPVFLRDLPSPRDNPEPAIRKWAGLFADSALTWDDLPRLREWTRLPILLKGILYPDDAEEAVRRGVDGIIVSNHGGRQVDGAIAALDALAQVVPPVDGRFPVLFDSGIRTGSDALKALALGAKAVLLGRPYIWALAVGGEQGVRDYLLNFLADFDLALALSGVRSVSELNSTSLTG